MFNKQRQMFSSLCPCLRNHILWIWRTGGFECGLLSATVGLHRGKNHETASSWEKSRNCSQTTAETARISAFLPTNASLFHSIDLTFLRREQSASYDDQLSSSTFFSLCYEQTSTAAITIILMVRLSCSEITA